MDSTRRNIMPADILPEEPSDLDPELEQTEDESEPEYPELPCTDEDDASWDAFLPDDEWWEPDPEPGDFWMEGSVALGP
jgi:hypothetical protein